MILTSRPVAEDWLSGDYDTELLSRAEIVYAPVAVTGVVIAFLANKQGHIETEIRLSPRLLAKLVTHSYALEQSLYYYNTKSVVNGPWDTNPMRLNNDPEFKSLNPDGDFNQGGNLILVGPNPSDAAAQLWAYLQADEAARAFLAGEPDNVRPGDESNSGMTLNPWYLPKGHPEAKVPVFIEDEGVTGDSINTILTLQLVQDDTGDVRWREVGLTYDDGTPMCLCDAELDSFLRPDETELPQSIKVTEDSVQWRFDVQQMRPFAASWASAAQMVFRADNGSKATWDPTKWSGTRAGAYVSDGLSNLNGTFKTGYTGAGEAARYQLPSASLGIPGTPEVFVDADTKAMAAAVAGQSPTGVEGVTMTDPATLPATAYPLTSVVYAAVNLAQTDTQVERDRYADLIEYAVTTGQNPGQSIGQLPDGYVPLTRDQKAQALAAVETIRAYTPAGDDPTDPPSDTPSNGPGSNTPTAPPGDAPSSSPDQPNTVDPADNDGLNVRPGTNGNTNNLSGGNANDNPPGGGTSSPSPSASGKTVTASPDASGPAGAIPVAGAAPGGSTDPGYGTDGLASGSGGNTLSREDPTASGDLENGSGAAVIPAVQATKEPTVTAANAPPAKGALGGGLVAGMVGMVAGPWLMFRRGADSL
jgi:hypothetical protein